MVKQLQSRLNFFQRIRTKNRSYILHTDSFKGLKPMLFIRQRYPGGGEDKSSVQIANKEEQRILLNQTGQIIDYLLWNINFDMYIMIASSISIQSRNTFPYQFNLLMRLSSFWYLRRENFV